jgi:putative ABC transport system permease protein
MSAIFQSLRFGLRMLRKSPGISAMAILALALGIGLTTMMFSVLYSVLYRGLPFEQAERLVHVNGTDPAHDRQRIDVPFHDYLELRDAQHSFESLAGFYTGTLNLSGTGEQAERFDGAFLSANTFDLLHVRPALGRNFLPGEDEAKAEPVVILGHEVWKNRYGGDPNVLGRAVRMNGVPATIIGVMPEGFAFPQSQQVWVPLRLDPVKPPRGSDDEMGLDVMGRLRDGVSLDEAQAEFVQLGKHLEQEYPATNKGVSLVVKPLLDQFIPPMISSLFWTMFGAVGLVLLMACANVANLLLARTAVRTKELAVRTALGAGRARIVLQLLVETLVLSACGALLGVGLAHLGVWAFDRATAAIQGRPYWLDFSFQTVAVVFIVAVTGLSALISGILPALQASRTDINAVLKDEARGNSSLRAGLLSKALVVFEVALACGLLVAAGLTIQTVANLRNLDLGFDMKARMTARVALFESSYPNDAARATFFDQLLRRLRARPDVAAAAVTTNLPSLGSWGFRYGLEGKAYPTRDDYPRTNGAIVSGGFFETFGGRVVSGRDFNEHDVIGAPGAVIVNESFARKVFGGEDPVGKRLQLIRGEHDEAPWLTVVGLTQDLHLNSLEADPGSNGADPAGIYLPAAQNAQRFMSIAVLGRGPAKELAPALRSEVAAIDADLPLYWVGTMDERVAEQTYFFRVFGTLFIVFGGVALFLASVGIYGVMSVSVSRRTQEIGVRMALGAQRFQVVGLVLKQGAWQVGLGLTFGLGLAWLGAQLLQHILFGVQPHDPATFAGISSVLAATGLLACAMPASRASRVDPMVALRHE